MRILTALLMFTGLCALAANAQLGQVQKVYLLPMSGSLDQYLATHLTEAGAFQVVTDPKLADAIFTDRIGQGFEDKLEELFPPEVPKSKDETPEKVGEKDPYAQPVHRLGSFSRGRGTLFLVDLKSRNVLWSIYEKVNTTRPEDVNRRAGRIVKELQKAQRPTK